MVWKQTPHLVSLILTNIAMSEQASRRVKRLRYSRHSSGIVEVKHRSFGNAYSFHWHLNKHLNIYPLSRNLFSGHHLLVLVLKQSERQLCNRAASSTPANVVPEPNLVTFLLSLPPLIRLLSLFYSII